MKNRQNFFFATLFSFVALSLPLFAIPMMEEREKPISTQPERFSSLPQNRNMASITQTDQRSSSSISGSLEATQKNHHLQAALEAAL